MGTEAGVLDESDIQWALGKLRLGQSAWWMVENVPEPSRTAFLKLDIKSTGAAPVFVEDQFIGAVTFDDCLEAREWPQPEIDALSAAANAIGGALQARLAAERLAGEREQAAKARVSQLVRANEALARSTARLANEPDLDRFLGSVLIESARQVGALTNALFLYDAREHTLAMRYFVSGEQLLDVGSDPTLLIWRDPVPANLAAIWSRLVEARPLIWRVGDGEPALWDFSLPWHREMNHAALICVPLFAGDRCLGFMGLGFQDTNGPSPERIELAQALANQAVLALELTRLTDDLKDNEARLMLAHDAAEIGTWDWDLETDQVLWSAKNFELWGWHGRATKSFISAESVLTAIHPEDGARVRGELQMAVSQNSPFRSEFRLKTEEGGERWLAGLGCHVAGKRAAGRMIGINIDVTARRAADKAHEARNRAAELIRANEALQRSVDRLASETEISVFLRAILEEMLLASDATCSLIFRYDAPSHCVHLSDAALRNEGAITPSDPRFLQWRVPVSADTSPTWSQDFGSVVRWLDSDHPTKELKPEVIPWNERMGFRKIALLKLQVGKRRLGFVALFFRRHDEPDVSRVEQCGTLAQQAALAIHLTDLAEEGRKTAEESATASERSRLAAEIHDGMQQLLLASQLWIGVLKSSSKSGNQGDDALRHLDELLQRAVIEARRTVKALRPRTLDEHDDLLAALYELAKDTTTTELECTATGTGSLSDLAPLVQDQLYRIAQEAVSNAAKHAHAKTLRIAASSSGDRVQLEICDDGIGALSSDLKGRGFGVANMRNRAHSIGGAFEVSTSPGQGFTIRVTAPRNGSAQRERE